MAKDPISEISVRLIGRVALKQMTKLMDSFKTPAMVINPFNSLPMFQTFDFQIFPRRSRDAFD